MLIGTCAALMLGFTFLNWYGVYVFVDVSPVAFGPVATHDAWHPFSPIDAVLAAAAAVLLLLVSVVRLRAGARFKLGSLAVLLGVVCVALILLRIANAPNVVGPHSHGVDTHLVQRLGPGGFLSLVSAAGVAVGGILALGGRRTDLPVDAASHTTSSD